jgi:hypothetical protein
MGGYLQDTDDEDDDEQDVGFNERAGRRDGLSLSMDARTSSGSVNIDDRRRLSRELEEGFADSSDEEEEGDRPAVRRGVRA